MTDQPTPVDHNPVAVRGSTRLDRWVCPLCGWVGWTAGAVVTAAQDHAAGHDSTARPDATIQQLHELPERAAEVFATWGHPNPVDRPAFRAKRVHPPAPADLAALDCLRPDHLGLLHRLAQCVRAVVEDMPTHPGDLTETPTWVSESSWLIAHADAWRRDPFLADWVASEVADIHRDLSRAARVHPPLRLTCPRPGCVDQVRLADGGQFYRCDAGHIIDHWAEIKRLGRISSVTLTELAEASGVKLWTLRDWAKRGLLRPDGRRGNARTFNLADAMRACERMRHAAV